jgi:hypothetical protein
MVAYSYKLRFADPMLDGIKDGTIRAPRQGKSRHARPGDAIQNYTGMRTQHCRLILKSVCVATFDVVLRWRPIVEVIIGDEKLPLGQFDVFARRDGFGDFDDMERFWAEVHPGIRRFVGELIRWQPPARRCEMGAIVATPKAGAAA